MRADTAKALSGLLAVLVRFLVGSWMVMVAFKWIHTDAPVIPAFGYVASAAILLVTSVLSSIAAAAWKETK